MKRLTVSLFLIGLLLEFAAFFGNQATNIPFILKLLAPDYYHAQIGIQNISTQKELSPGDEGFKEISNILLEKLLKQNDPLKLITIQILKFTRENAYLGFSADRAKEVIPVTVSLSNGQALKWDLTSMTEDVAKLQNKNVFIYALVIFILGVLIQCIAFIVEHRKIS